MSLLWKKYSYAIILVIFSFILGITMICQLDDHSDSYKHITVSDGQSLWSIANTYKMENGMTQSDFIKWVQDENNLVSTTIKSGQTIIIPIKSKSKEYNIQQLASEAK